MRYTREQACLAWLAQGMLGSRRLKKLLDEYGSAEAAYDAFQRDHGASLQNRISDYLYVIPIKNQTEPICNSIKWMTFAN